MRVSRQVRTFPGATYDLGYHIVWFSKYRRPVLGGSVGARLEELIRQRAVQRYIDTQYERVSKRGDL